MAIQETHNLDPDHELRLNLIKRIFVLQVALVIVTTMMIPLSLRTGLGWFWFAFVSGVFGSSIALLRRVTAGGEVKFYSNSSWVLICSPLLFGGILAGIAYFMMAAGLITGVDGDGLITMNLFPSFGPKEILRDLAEMSNFLKLRPSTLQDAAKLIVWCVLAGYSENFVTGILSSLEAKVAPADQR